MSAVFADAFFVVMADEGLADVLTGATITSSKPDSKRF